VAIQKHPYPGIALEQMAMNGAAGPDGARGSKTLLQAAVVPAICGALAAAAVLLSPLVQVLFGVSSLQQAASPAGLAAAASAALPAAGLVYCALCRDPRARHIISVLAAGGAAAAICALAAALFWSRQSYVALILPMGVQERTAAGSIAVCLSLSALAFIALNRYAADPAGKDNCGKCHLQARVQETAGLLAGTFGFASSFFLLLTFAMEDEASSASPIFQTIPLHHAIAFPLMFAALILARNKVRTAALATFITAAMMTPLAVLLFHNVQEHRTDTLNHTMGHLSVTAQGLAAERQEVFLNTRMLLTALTRAPQIAEAGDACNIHLKQVSLYQPWIQSIGIADAEGRLLCASQPQYLGASVAHRPYFQEARRNRSFTLSEIFPAITGKLQIAQAMPVHPEKPDTPVIIALLDPISFASNPVAGNLEVGLEITFVDRKGTLIALFPGAPGEIGTSIAEQSYVRKALGKGDAVYEDQGPDGIPRLFASRALADGAGVLIVSKERMAVLTPLNEAVRRDFLIITGVLAVILSLGYAVAHWLIFRPLKEMSGFARRLEEGDLHARLPIRPRGEIGSVCQALDHMAASLAEREARLKETRTLFESVFNYSRDSIFITKVRENGEIYIAICNTTGAKALRIPAVIVAGKTLHQVLAKEPADRMVGDLRRVLARGLPMDFEYHQKSTDRYWEGVHFPLRSATGRINSIFTSLSENTERKRADRMKTEFIATVSHELRTPLTSIAGALGLIAAGNAGDVGDKAAKLIKIAHQNAIRLVRLVNDVLDIEKIEAGSMRFDIKPVDLKAAVELSISSLTSYAQQYGVTVKLEDGSLNPLAFADEDRLVQVITNLISNAVKFSPRGEMVVVKLSPCDRRDFIRLTVSDRGPGIPDSFQPRIFGKFSQADNTDTRAKGGTGLGLAICKEIVERLGGRISFDTQAMKGTSFHVELRVAAVPASSQPRQVPGQAA
jgi:signal transduction histidine kinase